MTNFQGIATVTAALRQRLLETVQVDVPSASVTTLRPTDPGTGGIPQVGVNLFLFAVHISASHRNRDLPLRSAQGDSRQKPMIPLDLDYLVSFYGDQNGASHQLAGSVMRSLYARPILTADMIQAVEGAASGLDSGLADQVDKVHFTPLSLPIEEMSKLWSVFFQTSYALSVAFRAGPVLIEADEPVTVGPPVLTPQLAVYSLSPPTIESVTVSGAAASVAITPGAAIDLLGSGFDPANAEIVAGSAVLTPAAGGTGARLTVTLPADLAAGAVPAQVRQAVPVGTPPVTRSGPLSNSFAFMLHPVVTQGTGGYDIAVTGLAGTGADPRSATVTVGLDPAVGATQMATLELLDLSGAVQYEFVAAPRTAAASSIAFAVSGIAAGTYAVRARVDTAETPVAVDQTTGPTKGQLVPQVAFA
jgi:hypothetical protein